MSDKSVIKFTWKTFVSWEIMFYIAAAVLVFKSYYDRFGFSVSETPEEVAKRRVILETCTQFGFVQSGSTGNRTLLATVDQLSWMQDAFSKPFLDLIFWINLAANIICLNITFLSEVFFMVMISIIFHAFIFIHKQIDGLLGNPDSIFNINVVHEPLENAETEADHIVRKELKEAQVLNTKEHCKKFGPCSLPNTLATIHDRVLNGGVLWNLLGWRIRWMNSGWMVVWT